MIEIRESGINDCHIAVLLGMECALEEGLTIQEFTYSLLFSDMCKDMIEGKRLVWLAVDNTEVVGTCQLKFKIDAFAGGYCEFGGLYVIPTHRGTKAARLLVETASKYVPNNYKIVISTRKPLPKSYIRHGFSPISITSTADIETIRGKL